MTTSAWSGGSLFVLNLTTEFADRPVGIDVARPRLGWKLQSTERAQVQRAYRILVASSPTLLASEQGNLWDSGKVLSDRTLEVPYAGPALQSATRYFWKVQAWDAKDVPSEWSPPSCFETGLLEPSDWQGQWIGWGSDRTAAGLPLSDARWIWGTGQEARTKATAGTCFFRKALTLPAGKPITEALFAGSASSTLTVPK